MALTNLEVHWLVRELQCLVGCHFDKISDLDSGWKLKFGKNELVVDVPERLHLSWHKRQGQEPHSFAQYCRAHMHGKVMAVRQPGFDRVVAIDLEGGQTLVFELFSDGNAVLVGANGATERAFRDGAWKDRVIKRGEKYAFPASGKLDPREITEAQFNALFGEKDVIHSLISGVNIAGKDAELACAGAGQEKTAKKPNAKLFAALKRLLEDYAPGIQGTPTVREIPGAGKFEPKESFNRALDDYYAVIQPEVTGSGKVERKIRQQEEAIAALEKKADELKAKGDAIYERWQELEKALAGVKKLRAEGRSYDDIGKMLAGKGSIDKKTKKLTVKL